MWTALLPICLGLAAAAPARAADSESPRRFIFFSGVDTSSISVFSWGGVDTPVFSSSRDVSGMIVRAMGGTGAYDYEREGAPDGRVIGTVAMGEILAGWRHIGTAACITVLGGFAAENHTLDVDDPINRVQGTETGAKILAELFWRPTARTQIDASASFSTVFESWRVRLAGGATVFRGWVAGLEGEAFGNLESDQVRLGVYVADIAWKAWTFKAAVGGLNNDGEYGAYGRLGTDLKF